VPYTQENLYFSISTPLGPDTLLLTRFSGEEQVSGLFHFHLELQSETADVDFSAVVGQGATITIDLADDTQRYLHGIVTSFRQGGRDAVFTTYYAELRPTFYLLTQAINCRIFQNLTVPDILSTLFGDLGLTDFKDSLTGTYPEREYCVQYNETAFDFASRLMEEEGIFYFFEHEDGKHTLVLADASEAIADCPGAKTAAYGTEGLWVQQNVVTRCTLSSTLTPGAYALDDFSFETPSVDLEASTEGKSEDSGASRREIYRYPGGFTQKERGTALSKLRIEAEEVPGVRLSGESYSRAFTSGFKFTLEEHYRADVNAAYALVRIHHQFEWDHYENSFEAIPADVPFRPLPLTPKPKVHGTQTALVVGKSGEEIWTDEFGRIKVQFHWDREGQNDENSSCWIRVAHPWASKGWGQIFLPRIGNEVVVSFLDGDPDRPLVTGSVYNAEQTVPYKLPAEQTKSTIMSSSSKGNDGFNELRFEDKAGEEEVYFHAQKDHNLTIENDRTKDVLNDEVNTIKNSRTTTVQEADDTLTVSKGNRLVNVDTGNEEHTVKGDVTFTVSGNLTLDVTGKIVLKAGQSVSIEAGTTFDGKAGTSMTHKAGTDLTNQAGTALTNKAGTTMTNEAAISLTNKGSATQTVDGGGMLTLKGGLIKIN
jgi:type VI secretion system secreted protein VgrG